MSHSNCVGLCQRTDVPRLYCLSRDSGALCSVFVDARTQLIMSWKVSYHHFIVNELSLPVFVFGQMTEVLHVFFVAKQLGMPATCTTCKCTM